LQRRINIPIIVFVILCSTSFYNLALLGQIAKVIELIGSGIILCLLLLHIVYANHRPIKQNFYFPVVLILISLPLSMLMANYCRNQEYRYTMFAQQAMYYYFFYFLLYQLKVYPRDLERIFIALGLLYVALYLIQFFLYPKIIFQVFILHDRGTIRIYLSGSGYLLISYLMSIQAYFRTNRPKYLFLILLFLFIYVLLGSRETLAIMTFLLILFLIVDKKVKSKFFNVILILSAMIAAYFIFQGIIEQLIHQAKLDSNLGSDYIRILAYKYYLTDFFKCPLAYLTGNGMAASHTAYGNEIEGLMRIKGYYLGDIGLVGNYALYGAFFLAGVIIICIRALRIKIEKKYDYLKYMFIAIIISLSTGGGFAQADFVCFISIILYIIDVSFNDIKMQNKLS